MGKKILKVAGIGEIILAVFFLGVALISKDDGGALFLPDVFTKSIEMLALAVAAVRLVFGLFGMLGKGRPMLIFFSFLLIFFSIPSPSASKVMLVIYIVALVVSMLYLVGALLLKKPAEAVGTGASATTAATDAATSATQAVSEAAATAPEVPAAPEAPAEGAIAASGYPGVAPANDTQTEDNSAN